MRFEPDSASYHGDLGRSYNYVGVIRDEARNHEPAIRAFRDAIREQQIAIGKTDSADLYRWYLANHLENLGEQYLDTGRPAEGLKHYNDALKIRRDLSASNPEKRQYKLELASALEFLGNIERHLGDAGSARRSFEEARRAAVGPLNTSSEDPEVQVQLGAALEHEAVLLADLGQIEQARPLLEQAAKRFQQAAGRQAPAKDLALDRELRSETLWNLARILGILKLPQEAQRVDAERNDLWKNRPPAELVDLALKHLSQATMFAYGKMPLSDRAAAVRELDLEQAAAEVRLAVACGLEDDAKLTSAPEASFLLKRADVKSALKQLKTTGTAPGGQKDKKGGSP